MFIGVDTIFAVRLPSFSLVYIIFISSLLPFSRFIFATAPVNTMDPFSMTMLYDFAAKYALQQPIALNIRLARSLPRDLEEFGDLCLRHNVLDLYVWLSFRFPKYFIEQDVCLEQKTFAIKQIEATLQRAQLEGSSHGTAYNRARGRVGGKLPEENEHIRDTFLANLAAVPENLRVIISEKDGGRSGGGGSGGSAGFGGLRRDRDKRGGKHDHHRDQGGRNDHSNRHSGSPHRQLPNHSLHKSVTVTVANSKSDQNNIKNVEIAN